ncbi:MAG: CSLREA domain-containing protein [Solirubrobacteraceae bacterium]
MTGRSRRLLLALAVMLAAFGVGASGACAATFVVSTTEDFTNVPKANPKCAVPCSLREAIEDANASPEKEPVVEVPPGTYTLSNQFGELDLEPAAKSTESVIGLAKSAGEVVIKGAGSGRQVMRVGTVGAAGEVAVLAMVEITGGESVGDGGGIYVDPNTTLTLTDAAVVGNKSEESGGGVYAAGVLNLVDSLIAHNEVTRAGSGGGIDVASGGGPVTVANSTIAYNVAAEAGGGIDGGLSAVKVVNATIAGNEALGKGGGLASETRISIANSILADNTAKGGPENCSSREVTGSIGGNLSDDNTCLLMHSSDKESTDPLLVETGGLPLLANNGGPTETIALQPTSPAIGAAEQLLCVATDQRGVARPSGACDSGAFQYVAPTPSEPGGGGSSGGSGAGDLAPPPSGPPAPVLGLTGDAALSSGRVFVKLPGTSAFVALTSLREIPFGTVINATNGTVTITTAGPHGGTQTGQFFGGEFVLTQGRNGLVVAALTGGSFSVCPTARERSHLARASAKHASGSHVVRKLWANAHGSFSTKGNYAAGAVEGTEWLTEDLCDGTLIRVTRDKVAVTNLVNHRHFTVKAGHRYFAKAP